MKTLEIIKALRMNYKNWISLGLGLRFGRKIKLKAVLRSGESYDLQKNYFWAIIPLLNKGMDVKQITENLLKDRIPYKGHLVIIHGWISENNQNNGDIFDVYIKDEYNFLNVQDKDVLDIGGSIGDSAIYFAINGARKVISLEPYPYSFNYAVRNINENGFGEKIVFLNGGYGKDSEIVVDEEIVSADYMALQESKIGRKIRTYSLKLLVKEFNLENAILKMDCEGCEYNLVNEDRNVLDKFSQVLIEYHYGTQRLVEKLINCGFSVKYTHPKKHFDPDSKEPKMLGYIYATNLRQS